MEKRHYADFFTVPQDYKANMTREAINETPETWLDFYPHTKYVEFLKTLIAAINGGSKSIWLTGNYGTGKSNAALVAQKLFMDDIVRVNKWFEDCKDKIDDYSSLQKNLIARRDEGTLVVYDYNASGVGPNEDFLVRLERGIVFALAEKSMIIPAKANLDAVTHRLQEEDKMFFAARDEMQGELSYLNASITTVKQLIAELKKPIAGTDVNDLLGDVQKVLHRRSIYLDISVSTFKKWINEILSANGLKRIIYIFDEFHPFIEANKENLKTFEDVSENPGISKFYLVPVTHMQIQAYWAEGSASAKKSNDRFHFRNLQMPNDTAFKLAAHAMKPIQDADIADEWKTEKTNLWETVRGIAEQRFNSNDPTSADYVSKQSFYDILPIHPMTAFLLKFLSEAARSNQRSIFEYLKGSPDGSEFQDFIRVGGPEIASKQFLTADYLWKYFIERDDLGLNKEIVAIRAEFERIKSRDFQNKDDDDEDIRVLKAVLLFCLLSRLMNEPHERLKPTVENIKLAFQGDGVIVGVESIIKSLVEKHCFSVTGGNIELYASFSDNADLQKKKIEFENKFHELLSAKTEDALKAHRKSDISKFSMGRFDLRVSDIGHTTLTNITSATRDKYGSGQNKDTGAVCLWFVVAKNKDEQLQVLEKIRGILNQLRDHRIVFFAFPTLTFCDSDVNLWNDFITQLAMYSLDSKLNQSKMSYERLEREWFDRLKKPETPIKVYTIVNGQVTANDASWGKFKDIVGDYVKRTLSCCVDPLTEQTTAFGMTGLCAWATAGIQYDNASGQYKQLVEAFKKQGITADANWFSQNPNHPIAQIRSLFDKKIANSIGKQSPLSIRKVYIELQRAPYGMKYNALSAFVLGVALRHILEKGYQWDDKVKTGALDVKTLAEIIEAVVKDDGQSKIKNEKEICRLSHEEKVFIEKAPLMFGITNAVTDARVEDVILSIQTKLEQISGRVPLWVLPEYIRSVSEPLEKTIKEVLKNICLAGRTSSKSNKTDERTDAVKAVGRCILENAALVDTVAKYTTTPDNYITAFQMYVDSNAPLLVSLAKEIGDISHGYCDAIKNKASEASALLWKEADISDEINETEQEYGVIKLLKPIAGFAEFLPYKSAFDILLNAISVGNKLPRTLIVSALPSLAGLISAVAENGTASDIKDGLEHNSDIVKALFFDVTRAKSIELLKQRLSDINIVNGELLTVYNALTCSFSHDENVFLEDVRSKIESNAKDSVSRKIKEQWYRLTGAMSSSDWAITNGIPSRFALGSVLEVGEIVSAVSVPENFSSDKLSELLNILESLSPIAVADIQQHFLEESVPQKFAKFNINLSSLLEYLKSKYGSQPDNWPTKLDLNEFIRGQYRGTFAPQVAEKIKKISAEDLKKRLLTLAQDDPDLGLLFWE